jgi:hypothetical protein
MTMSAPTGSAASSLTDERPDDHERPAALARRQRSTYLSQLDLRRQAAAIRRQTAYGLVMGWVLTLVGGFVLCCVPSRVDWLWQTLFIVGLAHLFTAVTLPQALAWPERAWMTVARWQGWVTMSLLLTIVYFLLIWPASFFDRKRTSGFVTWTDQPPDTKTAWQSIDLTESTAAEATPSTTRGYALLLASVIAFFFRRGNYLLIPIVILLIILGLALYFVQSSALAPFIYPLL